MKKSLSLLVFCAMSITSFAQKGTNASDTTTFCGYFVNKEYNIYIDFDLYHNNISVPGQELFGPLPGYLGDKQDSRKWLLISAEIRDTKKASVNIINDYGSEDLSASLTSKNDSTVVLKQEKGSDIKIARNRKWVKLPTQLEFVKAKR